MIGPPARRRSGLLEETADPVRAFVSWQPNGAPADRSPFGVGVKDVIDVAGLPTRLGTPNAGHHLPRESAHAVECLVRGGATVVGKTATHELALGLITPGVLNPFDGDCIAGGSSGGSAAAVGAGIVAVALGTDTSGSVRCPAALCGVVGLKPTFGSIPTRGVAPLAPSQDTVGLLAATVSDCAFAYSHFESAPPIARTATELRVGVDATTFGGVEPDVAAAVREAVAELRQGNCVVPLRPLPFELAAAASALVIFYEAPRAWAADLDQAPEGFSLETRTALRVGARAVSASRYQAALRVRESIRRRLRALFDDESLDAVVSPTVGITAPLAGERVLSVAGRRQPREAPLARFTALASVTGWPSISVPCRIGSRGLPIGAQLIARPGAENVLLELAGWIEATPGGAAVGDLRRRRRERWRP